MRPSDLGGGLKDVIFVLTEQTVLETENQHVKEMLLENRGKKKKKGSRICQGTEDSSGLVSYRQGAG